MIETVLSTTPFVVQLMSFCCSPLETCATSQLVLVSTDTIFTVVAVLGVFLISSAQFLSVDTQRLSDPQPHRSLFFFSPCAFFFRSSIPVLPPAGMRPVAPVLEETQQENRDARDPG